MCLRIWTHRATFYFSVLKIEVVEGDWRELDLSENDFSGVLVQYPDTDGHVSDFSSLIAKAKESKVSS